MIEVTCLRSIERYGVAANIPLKKMLKVGNYLEFIFVVIAAPVVWDELC